MVLSKLLKSTAASRPTEHVQVSTCNSTSIQNWGSVGILHHVVPLVQPSLGPQVTQAELQRTTGSDLRQVDGADISTNYSTHCASKRFQAGRKYFVSLTCSHCQAYIRLPYIP